MEDLSGAKSEVSVLLEVLRHGDHLLEALPHQGGVVVAAEGVRPPPREEGAPAVELQTRFKRRSPRFHNRGEGPY